VTYDEETLMAYADGELDEATRAAIAAAIAKDPELARRVEKHRALRAEVSGAFATLLGEPVPERLEAAARGPRQAEARGKVVRFPSRGTRAPSPPWRAREWTALAASLALGMFLSWRFLGPGGGDFASGDGALVARGDLARALDIQLASDQSADSPVLIGLTFKSKERGYCRTFVLRDSSTAGLACREGNGWRIPATQSVVMQGGDVRQASASLTSAILASIAERSEGEALDAAEEEAARDAGWK
jgi:hypothetical protein